VSESVSAQFFVSIQHHLSPIFLCTSWSNSILRNMFQNRFFLFFSSDENGTRNLQSHGKQVSCAPSQVPML
jgi:hypothetical protein